MIQPISSRANARIKLAAALAKSSACRKRKRFLMEGPRFVNDHLDRDGSIDFVVVNQNATKEASLVGRILDSTGHLVLEVPEEIYSDISNTGNSQGIAAICPIPEHSLADVFSGGTVLVLDNVNDPGNAGTAIRSAAAFACSGVVFLKGSAFPWSPKVTRSAAGLNSSIPICEAVSLAVVKDQFPEYQIFGADSGAITVESILNSLSTPVCIVIGSEAHGLSETTQSIMTGSVSIPMAAGVESLNAGVSASIILSDLFRKNP